MVPPLPDERPSSGTLPEWRVTRRALLQALGLGAMAAPAAGHAIATAAAAAAQATPDASPGVPAAPKRAPGGPTLDQLLWDLEYDATKIFRFVADEVAYEAYPGILRGVKGTHWSLAGNSVDKALLLAELLTQAQVTVRLVSGTLDAAAADELMASMRIDADAAMAQMRKVGAGSPQTLDQRADLTPEARTALASPETLRATLLDRATTQLKDGLETIGQALAAGGVDLATPELALPDRERRQHVWVQYADGPRWVDLDPSFANAEPGIAYAKLAETWDIDALPEDLYHRVRFRCIVASNTGGAETQEDAFVHEARAADLVGVAVVFAHVDPNAIAKLGVSIGGILEGTTQYVPTLLAGEGGQIGTPITLGGGGGALDVLGDAGSGDGGPLGEWLEIAVLSPDVPEQVVMREVFDRVGIERRGIVASDAAAGATPSPGPAATPESASPGAPAGVDLASLPPIDLIDDPQLGKVFLPLEATWLLGVVGGRIPGTYFDQDYTIADVEADMAVMAHGAFAARDGLQAEIAAAYGYRWYHDRPNITAAILAPDTRDASAIRLEASLDLIAQGYATMPLAGTTGSVHPQVLAGVLAHVAERFGAEAGAVLTPDSPPPAGSVAQVFAEAASAGVPIRTLLPGAADLSALAVSAVAKARIGEALASGYVVIVPERAVTQGATEGVGWWQVDPATGRTFDLMENGRGGSPMGEDTVIIVGGPAWRAATAWKILSFTIGVIVGFSTAMAIMMYPN